MRFHLLTALPLLAAGVTLGAHPAGAQTTLRGSQGAVDRTYAQALKHDLAFYRTPGGVRAAVERGELVRIRGNEDFRVYAVNYPYVLPTTLAFIKRLAGQYHDQCGEKMVVTSGVRPKSFHLFNSVDKSVHPAGMAVDIRKPGRAGCANWLRETLLAVEGKGAIDATEEHHPAHFHVAVYPEPYLRYIGRAPKTEPEVTHSAPARTARLRSSPRPTASASTRRTYRVRRGDSLTAIARRYGTSVASLKAANGLRSSRVQVGKVLVIPAR